MTVLALGLNHTTAPLDLRGRFAFPLEQLAQAAAQLRAALAAPAQSAAVEAAILSTCNRTELYVAADQPDAAQNAVGWLAHQGGVSADDLRGHIYTLRHDAAARHAFRVASGLDSMVLGEVQILGQFKDAVRAADEAGTLGSTLNQLFQRSFAVAKDVRSQTEIGMASISLAAAAVRLSAQVWERLSDVSVLFVGAGEMIELAAKHFAAQNPKRIAFANRTLDRGELLATQFNAQAFRLAELPDRLKEFDVVVSCTASTLPIMGLGAVERALKARRHKPMVMVDLAVPRDIEAEVKGLDDVYLYTIDDLAGIVQRGKAAREAAVGNAEQIVGAGVDGFMQWLAQRESVPLIQRLNAQAETWRAVELERARKAIARGEDVQTVLEHLAKGITQKALHGAYAHLNDANTPERVSAAAAIERLFLQRER